MKRIPYSKQTIGTQEIKAVCEVLKSDYLSQGDKIKEFEKAICEYTGAKYAVVFNSGTAALHAAYFATGLGQSDEFITSPLTFAATVNAGLYLGAHPKFIDVNEFGNLDPEELSKRISNKTKLIVPIHYSGLPVDLEKISKIKKDRKIFIVEDACHALGSEYKEARIGDCRFSDAAVFSFHPLKSITTGEGGAMTTNKSEIYEKALLFRNHGIIKDEQKLERKNQGAWYMEMQILGYNYRLTDIQAAIGLEQLKKIDKFIEARRRIAASYDNLFKNNPYFDILLEPKDRKSSYHLYPILLKDKYIKFKKDIFSELIRRGIGVQVHYIPVYKHPFYQKRGFADSVFPHAEKFYEREISIPIFPSLTHHNFKYISTIILDVFGKLG